ncbi:MAG: recombination protein RecR [Deltaproteobacteria bacterium RIFCSPLOWO2_02_FULL_53_8]|nr:MAG: recombination protein RecR [Deltaproteobacteria bacterium RIFCSPLOWO2_02_FULL_53_8]
MQYAAPITRLIKAFTGLPGIGEKTAARLALFVLNSKKEYAEGFAAALMAVKEQVSLCSVCMTFSDTDPCVICSDVTRDAGAVCVVSDYKDMVALEAMAGYKGRYHILHGSLAPLKGVGPDEIRLAELLKRTDSGTVNEVILATGFDAEGDATATYIAGILNGRGLNVTRIASGVPVGGSVEYMDGATLGRAMNGRKAV